MNGDIIMLSFYQIITLYDGISFYYATSIYLVIDNYFVTPSSHLNII